MAIAAVYIFTLVCILFLWLGSIKQDYLLTAFSGMLFVVLGIMTFTNGYEDLPSAYITPLGVIFLFTGLYVMARTGIELLKD